MAEKEQRVSFHLPFEIVIEILSKSPAKSLLRFKSVCKAWYNLIKNPKFIEKHLKDSPVITSMLVTTLQRMYFKDEGFYKSVDLESLFLTNEDWFDVVGICNGIVCVQFCRDFGRYDYIIGNPSIRYFRRIPSPNLSIVDGDLLYVGFSSFLNDYKLVRVIYPLSSIGEVIVKAEVYTMSTDHWVEIDVKIGRLIDVDVLILESYVMMPVLRNGVFYWDDGNSTDTRIVSFDISSGLYYEFNIPSSIIDVDKNYWKIVEFEQEISLINYNYYNDDRKFEVWALNANENSWTWKLRVDNIPRSFENVKSTITVVGYNNNGELLIVDCYRNDVMLLLYDLDIRQTKTLPYVDVQEATGFYFYTGSLLSVRALNEE